MIPPEAVAAIKALGYTFLILFAGAIGWGLGKL